MNRLLHTMRLDANIQWRNRLYIIGIGLALLLAVGLSVAIPRADLGTAIPMLFLFAIGGTTMLYVVGLLIFEKDQGTLEAMLVSPLRLREYMTSKLTTLSFLALLESLTIVLIAYGIGGYSALPLVVGILLMGIMLTLVGVILVVRYDTVTDALIPVAVVALVAQLPFLHFTGIAPGALWLVMPTTAPTVLMWAAWNPVEPWELVYGIVYSVIVIALLYRWATAAFYQHIVLRG